MAAPGSTDTRALLLALFAVIMLLATPSVLAASSPKNTCVECHSRGETVGAFPSWAQDFFLHWYGAVHGKAGVTCDDCHGGNPAADKKKASHVGVFKSKNPRSMVYYKNLPKTCGTCHKDVAGQFSASHHSKNLVKENLAPSCTTCHGFEMEIEAVNPLQLAGRCSLCHAVGASAKPAAAEQAM